jgi:hypothetical protein
MRYLVVTNIIIAIAFVLLAFSAVAETAPHSLRIDDEKVYADLPMIRLDKLLHQISDAAGIELEITGGFDTEVELYADGTPLGRIVNSIIPEGAGYALESDAQGNTTRLLVFSRDKTGTWSRPANERQQDLARQPVKRDDDTANFMHATLSNRELADTQSKLTAIYYLADIDSDRAIANLQAGIGDPDTRVRLATAKALYRIQGDEAIALIGQIYYDAESTSIRKDLAAIVIDSTHPLARKLVSDSGS